MIKNFLNRHKVDTEVERFPNGFFGIRAVSLRCVALSYSKISESESIFVQST